MAGVGDSDMISVTVEDNNDGTYAGTYTVPKRGDYEVRLAALSVPSLHVQHVQHSRVTPVACCNSWLSS